MSKVIFTVTVSGLALLVIIKLFFYIGFFITSFIDDVSPNFWGILMIVVSTLFFIAGFRKNETSSNDSDGSVRSDD